MANKRWSRICRHVVRGVLRVSLLPVAAKPNRFPQYSLVWKLDDEVDNDDDDDDEGSGGNHASILASCRKHRLISSTGDSIIPGRPYCD